ncbi:MAG: RidA family protein [Chloroflexi bacterium]|nr:MAG: RidA family protein [Chloroflexota bacterium]
MERVYLEPLGIAGAPEPYSHAIRCGNTIYIAGQVAFDESNRVVGVGDARKQAERVWHNIRLAVEAAGGKVTDIVKITVFLKDIRHAGDEIAVRGALFKKGRYPICTQVQVANLGLPDLLMEVDAIAVLE